MIKKLFICIIDQFDGTKDPFIYGFCKNIMEFWIRDLQWFISGQYNNIKIFCSHDAALDFLYKKDYEHALFINLGNDLQGKSEKNFIENFLPSVDTEKDVLIGHILDRQENYYELHDQSFYLNIKILKTIGKPKFGNKEDTVNYKQVIRSKSNHHDEYTPYWIKQGKRTVKFIDLKFGHNIINKILDNGYKINSFNKDIRNSKQYFYPENNTEFYYKVTEFVNKNLTPKFFAINTEKIYKLDANPISIYATVCAGLNHLIYLKKHGYNKDLELIFFDNNPQAVFMMKKIYKEWDGYNYIKFLQKYNAKIASSEKNLIEKHNIFLNEFSGESNFANWFKEYKENVKKIYFYNTNIFNTKSWDLEDIHKNLNQEKIGQKIFWLSNIFTYRATCIFNNTESVYNYYKNFLQKFKDIENLKVHAPISLPLYDEMQSKLVLYDGIHFDEISKKDYLLPNQENYKKTLNQIFNWNCK